MSLKLQTANSRSICIRFCAVLLLDNVFVCDVKTEPKREIGPWTVAKVAEFRKYPVIRGDSWFYLFETKQRNSGSSYVSSDRYFARCCDMLWIFKISKSWGRVSLIRCYRIASYEIAVFLDREKRDSNWHVFHFYKTLWFFFSFSLFFSLSSPGEDRLPFMNLPESLHLPRDFSRKFFEQIFRAPEVREKCWDSSFSSRIYYFLKTTVNSETSDNRLKYLVRFRISANFWRVYALSYERIDLYDWLMWIVS